MTEKLLTGTLSLNTNKQKSVDGTGGMADMGATIGICATLFPWCTANCRADNKTCSKHLSLKQASHTFFFLLFFKGEQIVYDVS